MSTDALKRNGSEHQGMQVSWREIEVEIKENFWRKIFFGGFFFDENKRDKRFHSILNQAKHNFKESQCKILSKSHRLNPSIKYLIISILHLTPSQHFEVGANRLLQHSVVINKSTNRNSMLTPFITIR